MNGSDEHSGTATAKDVPEVLAEVVLDGRLREVTIASQAIGGPISFQLLTPPDFSPTAARRWPVLLLLHGAEDGPSQWTRKAGMLERCAGLDALVVLPQAGPVGYYTNWERPAADGTTPRWEDFHLDELPTVLESRYRASSRRVVAGVSMGGYGAIAYAARRPGMFAAAASYSGMLHTLHRGMPSFVALLMLRGHEHPHALWGSPRRNRRRWQASDPHHLAERLRGTALYISRADGRPHPDDDVPRVAGLLELFFATSTESLVRRLHDLGIPATVSRGDGVHEWPTWLRELDRSWPFLLAGLGCA
ncbi:MAG TPA: alpha/beta hydrolase family protein [Solirubrobacteraceae bacterium]|jgi:S-formylglutathione hydrolase FrmB|nr:alpha/beta hydrolase family protein [Solirubrobacteraceae bacterium]